MVEIEMAGDSDVLVRGVGNANFSLEETLSRDKENAAVSLQPFNIQP